MRRPRRRPPSCVLDAPTPAPAAPARPASVELLHRRVKASTHSRASLALINPSRDGLRSPLSARGVQTTGSGHRRRFEQLVLDPAARHERQHDDRRGAAPRPADPAGRRAARRPVEPGQRLHFRPSGLKPMIVKPGVGHRRAGPTARSRRQNHCSPWMFGSKSSRPQNTAVRGSGRTSRQRARSASASTPFGNTSTCRTPASHRIARRSVSDTTQARSISGA